MRMVLGLVGLLVTLAIVGWIAKGQLQQSAATAPAAVSGAASSAATASARDLPRKIQEDLTRAMQQAPTRDDESR